MVLNRAWRMGRDSAHAYLELGLVKTMGRDMRGEDLQKPRALPISVSEGEPGTQDQASMISAMVIGEYPWKGGSNHLKESDKESQDRVRCLDNVLESQDTFVFGWATVTQ